MGGAGEVNIEAGDPASSIGTLMADQSINLRSDLRGKIDTLTGNQVAAATLLAIYTV